MAESKEKNGNQLLLKLAGGAIGALAIIVAGGVKYTADVVAESRVYAAKIEAHERDRVLVAEKLDKRRDAIDQRFRGLERDVAEGRAETRAEFATINAKLDTLMKDQIANHANHVKGTGR